MPTTPDRRGLSQISQAYSDLIDVATRKERPDHQEFLDLAVRIAQSEGGESLVALWLRDWKMSRYMLDLVSTSALLRDSSLKPELETPLISISVPDSTDGLHSHETLMGELGSCAPIRSLAKRMGIECPPRAFWLKDCGDDLASDPTSSTECRRIGCLQVWTSSALSDENLQLIDWIAKLLATNLYRCRSRREFSALKAMQAVFRSNGRDSSKWFGTAAKVLGEACSAEFAIVMAPAPERAVLGTAAWSRTRDWEINAARFMAGPNSIIRGLFERPRTIRLANWDDEAERESVCGTKDYDPMLAKEIRLWARQPQGTWMAAPVVVREQVLAVILLFGKQRNLPRQFSATDQNILESVCQYLANVLPPIVALKMIQNAASEEIGVIDWIGYGEQSGTTALAERLFAALQQSVPNINGATLWIDNTTSDADPVVVHLGGDTFLIDHSDYLHDDQTGLKQVLLDGIVYSIFVIPVPGLRNSRANFGVLVAGDHLSGHEMELLSLFVRVTLTNSLRAREHLETELRVFVEMRHNVRAGLHGLSFLTVAVNIVEILQRSGWPHWIDKMQKIGKAVRRSYLFAEQSRLLLEHSRLLHTGLKTDDLTPRLSSIGEIVREVNLALLPDSERFKVPVDVVDEIPRNEEQQIDRTLIYIVVFNLIENAIKYSTPGGHVKVRLYLRDRQWHMEVNNTGPYLSPDVVGEIFQPFVRNFESHLRKARAGTGLGLPTVRLIVHAHRGTVNVTSDLIPGQIGKAKLGDNTFKVSVPRVIL